MPWSTDVAAARFLLRIIVANKGRERLFDYEL